MGDGSVVIHTKLDNSGLKNEFSKIGNIAGKALKGTAVAVGAITTAFTGLIAASVNARGELEQQIGGVKKLFTTEMGDASQIVIDNAKKAYKTAGLSASDYMNTVTSFSASLISSLGGDTEKAAKIADRAIIDMSDNANTFGTDISMIQSAYQGFAKQNYTMLDNLKLGYGGTKTEMERLIRDASAMKDVQKELNIEVKEGDLSFDNIAQAITVVQKNMKILGTTEKEASDTLQGSIASMKSAWQNFLSGSGDLGQVVDTATDVLTNIIRLVNEAIPQIMTSITDALPQMLELGENLLTQLMQGITEYLPKLIPLALETIKTLVKGIISYLPQILEMGIQIISELIIGIAQMLPELIPQAVDCIITLVNGLLDNIDQLIDAGIELIIALAEGLIEALPRLIDKIPVIIEKLITAITNNLPKLLEMGIKLIIELSLGLIKAIPQLVSKIPQIVVAILKGLGDGLIGIGQIGLNLIKGLWNGISNATSWLWNKISGFCNSILNNIKGFFGIHSPSKVFADEIGQYLGLGLGEGFDDSLSSVYKNMKKTIDYENAKLTSNLTSTHQIKIQNEDNRQVKLESIDNNKEITVNTVTKLDGKVLTNTVNKVNARQKLQYGY